VREKVEEPVANDDCSDNPSDPHLLQSNECDRARQKAPEHRHDKAVAPWIGLERERSKRGVSGIDPNYFKACEQQQRPQEINPIRRGYETPQRNPRFHLFCTKGYG
jgi:hypothetical protein